MVNKFRLGTSKNAQTKETISRTLEIANNYAGELSLEVLPLDKIELDPENPRDLLLTLEDAINGINQTDPNYAKKKEDWKSLESLAKTIKEDQLINPILVYRFGNKCRIVAGERRTLASAIAGKKEIIARISSERPVGTKLKVLQWIENNERVDLTLAERISNIEAIIKEYQLENNKKNNKEKVTGKLLSDLTGMSQTQARRYLLILQSKPEIRHAILQGKLENLKLVEFICSINNAEHQNKLLDAVLTGLSFEQVCKLKNELESNGRGRKELRGRKRINVSLGTAKPNIVKIILDSLVSAGLLEKEIIKEMNLVNMQVQWNENESIEKSFKKVISLLDREVYQIHE